MADDKEAGTAVLEPEVPVAEKAAEGEGAAVPETDWKAEAETAKAELEKANQRLRSAEGRLKARVPTEEYVTKADLSRLTREIRHNQIESSPDLGPEQKKARLDELSEEEKNEARRGALLKYSAKLVSRVDRRLGSMGIASDHPKLAEFTQRWQGARSEDDLDAIYEEMDDWIDSEATARSKTEIEKARKEAETERQRANREAGTLAVGAKGGTGGSTLSLAALSAKDTRRMSPAELREHNKALDTAMRGR